MIVTACANRLIAYRVQAPGEAFCIGRNECCLFGHHARFWQSCSSPSSRRYFRTSTASSCGRGVHNLGQTPRARPPRRLLSVIWLTAPANLSARRLKIVSVDDWPLIKAVTRAQETLSTLPFTPGGTDRADLPAAPGQQLQEGNRQIDVGISQARRIHNFK